MKLTTGQHATANARVIALMVIAGYAVLGAGCAGWVGPGAVTAGIAGSVAVALAIAWVLARRCEGCGKQER